MALHRARLVCTNREFNAVVNIIVLVDVPDGAQYHDICKAELRQQQGTALRMESNDGVFMFNPYDYSTVSLEIIGEDKFSEGEGEKATAKRGRPATRNIPAANG